jgi:hypothetical protein
MDRKSFEVSEDAFKSIQELAAHGFTDEEISTVTGVRPPKLLQESFGDEMETEAVAANLKVAKTLFESAISGRSTTATMFWLRCRAGWVTKTGESYGGGGLEMDFGPDSESDE